MESEQRKKSTKTVISIVVIGILLIVLFFAAANIGSLKVSARQMFDGLFIAYDKDVATIYDLRFPRIIISMLAGAAIAVSGVLQNAEIIAAAMYELAK